MLYLECKWQRAVQSKRVFSKIQYHKLENRNMPRFFKHKLWRLLVNYFYCLCAYVPMCCAYQNIHDLHSYFRFTRQFVNIMKRFCTRNQFFTSSIVYLKSWFETPGQKKGELYLSPWNPDRWLSPQKTHNVEYVLSFIKRNKSLCSKQSTLNFWIWLHPKVHFYAVCWHK